MTGEKQAAVKAKVWLIRHRQQLQDQLDYLNDPGHQIAVQPEVIADTEMARTIVRKWIEGIDEVVAEL